MKTCIVCQDEFDPNSPAKRQAGGKITQCPDCSTDVVRYRGFQSADGKQSQATILKFKSDDDAESYISFWRNNSGFNKGKSCQLGSHLSTDRGIHFETVQGFTPTNHKGKA